MRAGQVERLVVLASRLRRRTTIDEKVGVPHEVVVADPLTRRVNHVNKTGIGRVESS